MRTTKAPVNVGAEVVDTRSEVVVEVRPTGAGEEPEAEAVGVTIGKKENVKPAKDGTPPQNAERSVIIVASKDI